MPVPRQVITSVIATLSTYHHHHQLTVKTWQKLSSLLFYKNKTNKQSSKSRDDSINSGNCSLILMIENVSSFSRLCESIVLGVGIPEDGVIKDFIWYQRNLFEFCHFHIKRNIFVDIWLVTVDGGLQIYSDICGEGIHWSPIQHPSCLHRSKPVFACIYITEQSPNVF